MKHNSKSKETRQADNNVISEIDAPKPVEVEVKKKVVVEVFVFDENNLGIPYEIYGEPSEHSEYDNGYGEEDTHEIQSTVQSTIISNIDEQVREEETAKEVNTIAAYVTECNQSRMQRVEDLEQTFDDIANIVDRFKSANYDLGMVAGRQMSTTSGEFIVHQIERDIMSYIDEQIAILPDPNLKKKKAKPEEVEMIREMLQMFLDENMDVIVPEVEEVEEEEQPIPEITVVYAVPGIGPPVDDEILRTFEQYAFDVCKVQADLFMPRNIRHFMCPPLEKYIEYKYDDDKDQVPTGGVITE